MKTLCLLAGLVAIIVLAERTLEQPPFFVFEQWVNHSYRNGEGVAQQVAAWMIDADLAADWARVPESVIEPAPFPLLLSAANPAAGYPYQTYTDGEQPRGMTPGPFLPPASSATVTVASGAELYSAVQTAVPGDIITIAPGSYDLRAWSIPVQVPGSADRPIYLRAETFGAVLLNLDTREGFHVMAPFWVFENLSIRGNCQQHSSCEHAFHVVGEGHSFVLRNSQVVNFNAPVKVNPRHSGDDRRYADNGLIEYNNFFNEEPRNTANPVTMLNIDSADGWLVKGNYIADFAKNGGDFISYGAFMKGNGSGGIFERNLVVCEHRLGANEGIRVGLSFGGGGMAARFCKELDCSTENSEGVMRNNIIMNCSRDVGIYLNRAAQTQVHHNLLYNNLGIDVRFETASAKVTNNIISGRIVSRDKGHYTAAGNLVARDCLGSSRNGCELSRIYQAPDRADFRLKIRDSDILRPVAPSAGVKEDFCGRPLPELVNIGPIQYRNPLDCLSLPDGNNLVPVPALTH